MVELIIRQPGHPDRSMHLRVGAHTIGRSEENDVVLEDMGVSRQHARVVVREDGVAIEDLGSGNGTFYKGAAITSHEVNNEDELVVEPFMLQFNFDIQGVQSRFVARLEVVEGRTVGEVYGVGEQGATIGRAEDQTIQIRDPGASRWHASVFWRDGECRVRDENSSNGIFVNGQRTTEAVFHHGDVLRISKTKLRYVTESLSAPTQPRPPSERTLLARQDRTDATKTTGRSMLPLVIGGIVVLLLLFLMAVITGGVLYWGLKEGWFATLSVQHSHVAMAVFWT